MLCYVMLCYVMLCYVMLCYVMLCYVMLCYVILYILSTAIWLIPGGSNTGHIYTKTIIIIIIIISFISVDPYRIRNGKWSHNHRVYETIKTIFVSLAPYKLFDILR